MPNLGQPLLAETTGHSPDREPSVAIMAANDRLLRSLGIVLQDAGYQTRVCRRADQLTELVAAREADLLLVDFDLPREVRDLVERELRALRGNLSVPVLGLCRGPSAGELRLSALRTGFWDILQFPGASSELLAKIGTFVSLKRRIDRLYSGTILDAETGHYTAQGLRRKLRELTGLMHRTQDGMTCVMFVADDEPGTPAQVDETGRKFSLMLHHGTRNSDVVARIEPLCFVVLAPHTPVAGGIRLAERFTSATLSRHVEGWLPVTFSAGVAGVECLNGQVEAKPELLLSAAERAASRARAGGTAQVASVWGAPSEKE